MPFGEKVVDFHSLKKFPSPARPCYAFGMTTRSTRREFAKGAAASAFAFQFVPRSAWGANERVRVASIGVGGKGAGEVQDAASNGAQIVALCDVDRMQRTNKVTREFPQAKFYQDFREMLSKEEDNIDAVTVSTPDHMHCLAAVTAMSLGKHVYCQKPLTHSIWEARLMTMAAKHFKVATQMGNQAHAGEPIRRGVELIRAGLIGKVKEVHCWTNRPIWPQGMTERLAPQPVPESLDWNRWLGPAPFRHYNKEYAPFKWRGWWDFGTGALGDMGCHIMDMPFWALELGSPTSVDAEQEGNSGESGPNNAVVTYRFPAGKYSQDLTFCWYDGGRMPSLETLDGTGYNPSTAKKKFDLLMIGEKGKFIFNRGSEKWKTFPGSLLEEFEQPERTIRRVTNEDAEWLDACKGGPAALSNFDYSGPFTETVLLGNLAVRLGKIEWDGASLKATNRDDAAAIIRRQYRDGWQLPKQIAALAGV
jgi:predicted dehydrogenase